jgi:hypothetical protein
MAKPQNELSIFFLAGRMNHFNPTLSQRAEYSERKPKVYWEKARVLVSRFAAA